MHVVVGLALEGLELPGADLELVHVLAEVAHVVAHRRGEALPRIRGIRHAALEPLHQRVEGVELDPVQQLLLARHVVVDPGQADLGLGGDAPHRGPVVALLGEHPGRRGQQLQQLAVEGRGALLGARQGYHATAVRTFVRKCAWGGTRSQARD